MRPPFARCPPSTIRSASSTSRHGEAPRRRDPGPTRARVHHRTGRREPDDGRARHHHAHAQELPAAHQGKDWKGTEEAPASPRGCRRHGTRPRGERANRRIQPPREHTIAANDRTGLENLCRYLGRPPLSADRLAETGDGNLSLKLKRPWSDGTTHLILSPTELIEKLIPLVPRPRAHLTRYHGVLAPSAGWRALVVPAAHTADTPAAAVSSPEDQNRVPASAPRRGRWTPWAALLKRVFLLDVLVCPKCSGRMRIVAAILEKDSIQAILGHCGLSTGPPAMTRMRGRLSPVFPGDPQDFLADPPAPDEG
jgi:Putative transposase